MSAALIDAAVEYEAAVAAADAADVAIGATYDAYQNAVVVGRETAEALNGAKLRLLGVAAHPVVLP